MKAAAPTTFYIRFRFGGKMIDRALHSLTDAELRWVMQHSLAECERRKVVRELHVKLSITDVTNDG